MTHPLPTDREQAQRMRSYYRWQSKLYDWTRWSFLFGRGRSVQTLPFERDAHFSVLEVGCGTGHNLKRLARLYPNARLHGLDVSEDMLRKAGKKLSRYADRTKLEMAAYGPEYGGRPRPDVILISYCLTMVNPGWRGIIERAIDELSPGGWLAVVDFHASDHAWFKKHMAGHHVRMEGHLRRFLLAQPIEPVIDTTRKAYGGVWEWMHFLGRK